MSARAMHSMWWEKESFWNIGHCAPLFTVAEYAEEADFAQWWEDKDKTSWEIVVAPDGVAYTMSDEGEETMAIADCPDSETMVPVEAAPQPEELQAVQDQGDGGDHVDGLLEVGGHGDERGHSPDSQSGKRDDDDEFDHGVEST